MKNVVILLMSMCFVGTAFASISLVNENKVNSIEVSYRFCNFLSGAPVSCTSINSVIVNADQNRVANIPAPSGMDTFLIVSANEKDSTGKIIAQGKYETDLGHSHCGYPLSSAIAVNNIVVSLSDMRQTSIIRCLANGY